MTEENAQRGLENLIVLLLGANPRRMSVLHLEKEVFLLWNFLPGIRSHLSFIKHYHGPFSREIQETIHRPLFLENNWEYIGPSPSDELSSGYVKLTSEGVRRYRKIVSSIHEGDELARLLSSIKMVRAVYDRLTLKELLLLIYDTYPEYAEKSNVFRGICSEKRQLAAGMLSKGIINEERYRLILKGGCDERIGSA